MRCSEFCRYAEVQTRFTDVFRYYSACPGANVVCYGNIIYNYGSYAHANTLSYSDKPGDIYAGLWYAVAFTALSAVVTIFFLKETRGKPLEEC